MYLDTIVLPPDPDPDPALLRYATGTYNSGFRSQVPRLTSIGLNFFNLTPSRSLARWLLMPPTALLLYCYDAAIIDLSDNLQP
jgi:hypothetical protein